MSYMPNWMLVLFAQNCSSIHLLHRLTIVAPSLRLSLQWQGWSCDSTAPLTSLINIPCAAIKITETSFISSVPPDARLPITAFPMGVSSSEPSLIQVTDNKNLSACKQDNWRQKGCFHSVTLPSFTEERNGWQLSRIHSTTVHGPRQLQGW